MGAGPAGEVTYTDVRARLRALTDRIRAEEQAVADESARIDAERAAGGGPQVEPEQG